MVAFISFVLSGMLFSFIFFAESQYPYVRKINGIGRALRFEIYSGIILIRETFRQKFYRFDDPRQQLLPEHTIRVHCELDTASPQKVNLSFHSYATAF